jgi:hypothetical protein
LPVAFPEEARIQRGHLPAQKKALRSQGGPSTVNRPNLTPEQAGKIRDLLRLHAAYLRKLSDRMRQRGFPFFDDLYVATLTCPP